MKIDKSIFLGDLYQIEQAYARAFKVAHSSAGQISIPPREKSKQMQLNSIVMDLICNAQDRYGIELKWTEECHKDSVPFPPRLDFREAVNEWNRYTRREGDHAVPQGEENEIPLTTQSSIQQGVRV